MPVAIIFGRTNCPIGAMTADLCQSGALCDYFIEKLMNLGR